MASINGNVLGLCEVNDFCPWELFNLNEKSFVVDLGGHSGDFSKYILETYNCRVDAYEPSGAFSFQHPKLKLIKKPVWNGSKVMFKKESGMGGNIFSGEGELVSTVDILKITKKHIDLMKVNIEGAEMEVLKRANLNNVDQLLVEFHAFIGERFTPPITDIMVEEVVKKIMSYGYKLKKINDAPAYLFYGKS